jgi:oxalate decarboxylase/phosphoglucose isomerase-like protein (cupin superfamily)
LKSTVVKVLAVASVLTPAAAIAQAGKPAPSTATYIMKEDIDKVGATEQSKSTRDENVKIVDLGRLATLPPGGTPGGITHDMQTEGYVIISGGGTMFTDGYIVNGRHNDQDPQGGPNGPTCGGMAYGVKKVTVKVGDVVIVPPGVVHGWADIPDHVDYLSFRPSQHLLQSGWVNPTIAK